MKREIAKWVLAACVYGSGCAGAFALPSTLQGAETEPLSEYKVKAAFLYNFPKFVNWPEESQALPPETVVVGVLGDDPFGPVLESTLNGRTAQGRRFVVRRFPTISELQICHVLFINLPDNEKVDEVLETVSGLPVLTVGEGREFVRKGGMIGLLVEGNKVRFDINAAAARGAGLEIQAPLLRLARRVQE